MSTCAINKNNIFSKRETHNNVVDFIYQLVSDIKKSGIKSQEKIKELVKTALDEYNIPSLIDETVKPVIVHHRSGSSSAKSMKVYSTEKTKHGYRILYISDKDKKAKIIHVSEDGITIDNSGKPVEKTKNIKFDIDEIKKAHEELSTKTKNKIYDIPRPKTFGSSVGDIDYSKENATIIEAEAINDTTKLLEIFDHLAEIDSVEVSDEYRQTLRDVLANITDAMRETIPHLVQVINEHAKKTTGKLVMEGDNKGIYININHGPQLARNQMSAIEVYVHELKHASLEFAQANFPDVIADDMDAITRIYEQFLEVVTEEDFMPPLNESIDRELERKIAKDQIAYLKRHDVGINEFIVMAETNATVRKILEDKITVKYDYKEGKNAFEKVLYFIQNIYKELKKYVSDSDVNLDGLTAMQKYIGRISRINNKAIHEIEESNKAVNAIGGFLNHANKKLSGILKKWIGKAQKKAGTAAGKNFEKELQDFLDNKEDKTAIDKVKMLGKIFAKWVSSDDMPTIGGFESYLELLGMKPEGTVQQLIRIFRNSDDLEERVEKLGLQSNKIEYETEMVLSGQAELIRALFGDNQPTKEESHSMTKILLDIDLQSLIDDYSAGTEKEKLQKIQKLLENKKEVEKEIIKTKAKIKEMTNSDSEYNFIVNQTRYLGKYMVTGMANKGMLPNSSLIHGMADGTRHAHGISQRNSTATGQIVLQEIDKLATLNALLHTNEVHNKNTLNMMKNNPDAILSILKYDKKILKEKERYNSYNFEFNHVKGYHEKISSSYINFMVDYNSNKEKNESDYFNHTSGGTFNSKFGLYINDDFSEPGWVSEGMIMANDGVKINSYFNVYKQGLIAPEDMFDIEKQEKLREEIKKEKKTIEDDVEYYLSAMYMTDNLNIEEDNKDGSDIGVRPLFSIDKKGKVFVTDLDISVNKEILEQSTKTKNSIDTVLGKTTSKIVLLNKAKDNNMNILHEIEKDMFENYSGETNYGTKNAMSYVSIGPSENNDLNKEIWPVLPRYMKIEMMKSGFKMKMKLISDLAQEYGLIDKNYDKIFTKAIKELEKEFDNIKDDEGATTEEIVKLQSEIFKKYYDNFMKEVQPLDSKKKKNQNEEYFASRAKEILDVPPAIHVRRNLVYHYFGNREASFLPKKNSKYYNSFTKFLTYLDSFWRHLVKIEKVNIVVRDLIVLKANILSNVLLAIIQGQNPIKEVTEEIRGMIYLHKYRLLQREKHELILKIKAGNATQADQDQLKLVVNKMNKNPVRELVEAGLFSSATEDLTNKDLHKEGYFDEKINETMEKLPSYIKKPLDVVYLTKETVGFRALLLTMQYSDFAARYSTYNRMKKLGATKEQAIKRVLDNQINYNFNHGKFLQWLNARGFIMFSKFLEGIQRVIKNTTLENPLNVAIVLAMGGSLYEDSPFGDSAISANFDARIHSPVNVMETMIEQTFEEPALFKIFKEMT